MDWPIERKIAWYIAWTEKFSTAFGELMGDRFIQMSSDILFAQDMDEIEKLKEFTDISLSSGDISKHYEKPINEKKHKKQLDLDVEEATERFKEYYEEFNGR